MRVPLHGAPIGGGARKGKMERATSGHEAGIRFRIDGRAAGRGLGLFGRAWGALSIWHERHRQRRELAEMSGRDLADLGIPPGLAAYEAGRWPWQKISSEWRALGAERRAAPPIEPFSSPPPRPDRTRGAPLIPFPSSRRRV